MNWRTLVVGALAAAATAAAPHVAAQAAQPSMVWGASVVARAGKEAQLESFFRALREAHDRAGSTRYWNAFRVTIGQETRYVFSSPGFSNWAEMPETAHHGLILAEHASPGTGALWDEAAEGIHSVVRVVRPDLSVVAPDQDSSTWTHMYFEYVTVGLGRNAAYEEAVLLLGEATRKTTPRVTYYTYSPGISTGNVYVFAAPVSDLAEMNDWDLNYHARIASTLGKEAADRWLEVIGETVVGVTTMLARVRPDLARPMPIAD
jgi:hypothetical protein